ncbi:glycoside hydrolase family 127 protein [Bacillus sp. SD088]|uniref:glycoside hydrolase family 127 protein n=1 Tax=Bacillus sp. SD088 TaxID=2782012 RepID=UPI001A95C681|nr:beta-L-arabinofuranosidase domain-containing protein [Bacillus sp. SD088]MBO0995178.1 glycoside hydrolase family 127 protein [Bacillus sp. SD088]
MKSTKVQKVKPIDHEKVIFKDRFWAPRIKINRERTIPFQYEQCKTTGRIEAFHLQWKPGDQPEPHPFWDSDIAKWIEAASYSLATHPDPELEALIDEVIEVIASAQQPDGYLNIYFTVVKPNDRWTDLRDAYELYCAGHLIEAGVAHYRATNKRTLLDIVCKYADYIDSVFGGDPGQIRGYPGHEEIELALVKLYRATDEERYLKLSQFFVDERGQDPHYFELEEKQRGNSGYFGHIADHFGDRKEYNQSHKPVREQTEVTGHSVRAMYLYSAMADLAYEMDDSSLLQACIRLWENMYTKKMYITGGIGSSGENEGFAKAYDLPNRSYAETCAAVGVVLWNHRMLQLDCDRKYADLMERALYNGVMSGISLDGKRFFYVNPLESEGDIHRREWFGVACCPPNIARLLASLGQYVYSYDDGNIHVHLYTASQSKLKMKNQSVTLTQTTNYPWDPAITITPNMEQSAQFALKLRIPGWCDQAIIKVNGKVLDYKERDLEKGYLSIERIWNTEDMVNIEFAMSVTRIYAHPNIRENIGRTALQRGPLVYCIEGADHDVPLHRIFLEKEAPLQIEYEEDLLNGIATIQGNALYYDESGWEESLYKNERPKMKPTIIKAIPYYAWDNRTPGEMTVWVNEIE